MSSQVRRQAGWGGGVSSSVFSFHLQHVSFEGGSIRGAFVRVCAGGRVGGSGMMASSGVHSVCLTFVSALS